MEATITIKEYLPGELADPHETVAMTGDWIQTYTGKPFWPAEGLYQNHAADIHDIAHALACNNRWTGHTRSPYSVAQHSVLGSYIVAPDGLNEIERQDLQFEFLMHDKPEAYIPDMSRPVKYQSAMAPFREIESRLEGQLNPRFGLPRVMSPEVKAADDAMLMAEYRDLMRPPPLPWAFVPRSELRYTKKITPWPWWYAEIRFLARYKELTGAPVWKKYLKLKWEDACQVAANW